MPGKPAKPWPLKLGLDLVEEKMGKSDSEAIDSCGGLCVGVTWSRWCRRLDSG